MNLINYPLIGIGSRRTEWVSFPGLIGCSCPVPPPHFAPCRSAIWRPDAWGTTRVLLQAEGTPPFANKASRELSGFFPPACGTTLASRWKRSLGVLNQYIFVFQLFPPHVLQPLQSTTKGEAGGGGRGFNPPIKSCGQPSPSPPP